MSSLPAKSSPTPPVLPESFVLYINTFKEATEAQELLFSLDYHWPVWDDRCDSGYEAKDFEDTFDSHIPEGKKFTFYIVRGIIDYIFHRENYTSSIAIELDTLRTAAQGRKKIKVGEHSVILTPTGAIIAGCEFSFDEIKIIYNKTWLSDWAGKDIKTIISSMDL